MSRDQGHGLCDGRHGLRSRTEKPSGDPRPPRQSSSLEQHVGQVEAFAERIGLQHLTDKNGVVAGDELVDNATLHRGHALTDGGRPYAPCGDSGQPQLGELVDIAPRAAADAECEVADVLTGHVEHEFPALLQ